MATVQQLMVSLGMDDSGLTSGASKARHAITGIGDEAEQVDSKLSKFGAGLGAAAAAAGAAAGIALSAALVGAVDAEAANAKFRVQLGGSAEYAAEMGKVSGSLFARGYSDNLGEINNAVAAVVQSGALMEDATNEQIESIAAQAMTLSKVFEVDVGESMRAVGTMVRTDLVSSAEEGMDLITGAFQQLGPHAQDVIDTLTEYPVQFKALGLSGTEALGLITQMMDNGARSTDLAADSLKEFAIRAVDGSKTSAAAYQALGLSAEEMTAKMARGGADARDVLATVIGRLNEMPPSAERTAAAVGLFGTQAEDLQSALLGLDLETAAARMGDVAGSAAEAAQIMEDTAAQKIQGLKNSFDQLMISAVNLPGPLGTAAAGVGAFGQPALDAAGSIAMIGLATGPALGKVLTFASSGLLAVGKFAVGLATRAVGMAASWLVAMGPVGWIIAGIAALAVIVFMYWDEIKAWTISAWTAVWGVIQAAWDWIVSIVMGAVMWVVNLVQTGWALLVGIVQAVWQAIVDFLTPVWEVIKSIVQVGLALVLAIFFTVWNAVLGVVEWVWQAIVDFLSPILSFIGGLISAAWDFVLGVITTVATAIWSAISTAWQAIVDFLSPILSAISTAVSTAWDAILSVITTVLDAVWGVVSSVWNTIAGFFSDVWSRISGVVSDGANRVWSLLTDIFNKIKGVAGEAINWLLDAGRNVVTGLWNGISAMGGWIRDKIFAWARAVIPGPILDALGIGSPSKVAADITMWVPPGMAEGLIASAKVATDAARDVARQTAEAAAEGLDDVQLAAGWSPKAVTTVPGPREPSMSARERTPAPAPVVNLTVNNPLVEPTQVSLNREMQLLSALGTFRR